MKKNTIIKILTVLLFSTFNQLQAQKILPLNEYSLFRHQKKGLANEGIDYVKDVTGILNPYIGTWEGIAEGKKYTIQVYKHTKHFLGIDKDIIKFKYIILDISTGQEIENTMALPEDSGLIVRGYEFYLDNSAYKMFYSGRDYKCGQRGMFHIRLKDNNSKLSLAFSPGEIYEQDPNKCTNMVQIFPVSTTILFDKQ